MLAKLILVVTMAASALMGGGPGGLCAEEAIAFDGYYLHVDALHQPSVWEERNGLPCLQTASTVVEGGPVRVDVPPDHLVESPGLLLLPFL